MKSNYKIGVFKIEYKKIKTEKRTRTIKILYFIDEKYTNNLSHTFIELKKIYNDWCYYFCEVLANEDYYFFNSKKSKVKILTTERGVAQ